MTRIVSPEEFVMAFHLVVRRRAPEIVSLWWDGGKYSELFLGPKEGVLQEAARALRLEYYREYFKIDAVFYERLDNVHFPAEWNMAERLAVAIEHENYAKSSPYEANKLSLLNVPLKVLITYPRDVSDETRLLSTYAEVLRAADPFHDFGSLRRQLVVFAFKEHDTVSWRYYVYIDRGFVPVGGES